MPCKHEGGSDRCDVYPSTKACKAYRRNYVRKYSKANHRRTGVAREDYRDRGAAGEHLVISDLLVRQLPTGGPYNMNGKHDLFVKAGDSWRTVQVKLGRLNLKTNHIKLRDRRGIISDVIAVVDLEGKRVRYISNTDEPLPPELL